MVSILLTIFNAGRIDFPLNCENGATRSSGIWYNRVYMYYLFDDFGGILLFIIIAAFVYLWVRVSRLVARVDTLESLSRGGAMGAPSNDAVLAARMSAYVANVDVGTASSLAAAPAPAPMYVPVVVETQEEVSARWLGWVGAIMLLLGVSFFLKYAFDNELIGPTGQVAMGIIAGIACIVVGQKLREKYLNYSDLLLGAGIGILYFSIYAGFAFYSPAVISQPIAFALMILVTTLAMVIAVSGNTMGLAVIGVIGGFMTPMLISTGENHLVTLSLYMLVLNIGVLGVSWFTKWTKLNYLTFFGTIILFGGWMESFYWRDPDGQLAMTFFFLTLFFLVFLVNSIMHHFVRKEASTSGDLILLALNAMGYFSACYGILEPKHHDVLGFFALVLAVLYLVFSYLAYAREEHDRTLNLTFPGIAVVFLSIAIPLQLTGYWISIAWLVESLVLVYVGLMIKEKIIQVFGWVVLLLGMVSMIGEVEKIRNIAMSAISRAASSGELTPIMNMGFFLILLGVVVFYVLAWLYAKNDDSGVEWKKIVSVFVVLANLLTIYALTTEISHKYSQDIARIQQESRVEATKTAQYQGQVRSEYPDYYNYGQFDTNQTNDLRSKSSAVTTIVWALYSTLLIIIGFVRRLRVLRLFGLIFFFITAIRVFIYVWELGDLARIFSTIIFGVIALGAAFLYAKYKHRLKEVIYG